MELIQNEVSPHFGKKKTSNQIGKQQLLPMLGETRRFKNVGLMRERTFTAPTTALGRQLGAFYQENVVISEKDLQETIEVARTFVQTVRHRVNSNRYNLSFMEPFLHGPALDSTATKDNFNTLFLYLPVKLKGFKLRSTLLGYTQVQLHRNPSYDRFEAIRTEQNCNLISPVKMYLVVHELIQHICQNIEGATILPLNSNSSDYHEGIHHILVFIKNTRLQIIPTIIPKGFKKMGDGTLIVAKPYEFDADPDSDSLWRYHNTSKANQILKAMNRADRDTRCKALRILLMCLAVDPVLRQCPPNTLLVVLYNMFDSDIDQLSCWQTIGLEKCFINLLGHLLQYMTIGKLLHPFVEGLDVMMCMPEKTKMNLKLRLSRLLANNREMVRLLSTKLNISHSQSVTESQTKDKLQ